MENRNMRRYKSPSPTESLWQSEVLLNPNPLLAPSSQPHSSQNKKLPELCMQRKAWAVRESRKEQFITDITSFSSTGLKER